MPESKISLQFGCVLKFDNHFLQLPVGLQTINTHLQEATSVIQAGLANYPEGRIWLLRISEGRMRDVVPPELVDNGGHQFFTPEQVNPEYQDLFTLVRELGFNPLIGYLSTSGGKEKEMNGVCLCVSASPPSHSLPEQ